MKNKILELIKLISYRNKMLINLCKHFNLHEQLQYAMNIKQVGRRHIHMDKQRV